MHHHPEQADSGHPISFMLYRINVPNVTDFMKNRSAWKFARSIAVLLMPIILNLLMNY